MPLWLWAMLLDNFAQCYCGCKLFTTLSLVASCGSTALYCSLKKANSGMHLSYLSHNGLSKPLIEALVSAVLISARIFAGTARVIESHIGRKKQHRERYDTYLATLGGCRCCQDIPWQIPRTETGCINTKKDKPMR